MAPRSRYFKKTETLVYSRRRKAPRRHRKRRYRRRRTRAVRLFV